MAGPAARVGLWAAALCLWATGASPAVVPYTATELGSLYGQATAAYGINDLGQVVGASRYGEDWRPFVWQNGAMAELPGMPHGEVRAINNHGVILGNGPGQSVIWENGTPQTLPVPSGGLWPRGFAINDQNQVAGKCWCPAEHAMVWDGSGYRDLGSLAATFPEGDVSEARGINNAGQVVGWTGVSTLEGVRHHAFLWENGVMHDLGTLGGDFSKALAINSQGHVVGESHPGTPGGNHAFIYRNGAMTDLGSPATLAGAVSWASALAINDSDQVAGYLNIEGQGSRAFVWESGTMYDLNSLALIPPGENWIFAEATAINNLGQIVVNDEWGRAFLLTPVPEPSTIVLLGGMVTVAGVRRRVT